MNETLSTSRLRLVALLAVVVVVGGGYWAVTRHKSSSPSTAGTTPAVTTPAKVDLEPLLLLGGEDAIEKVARLLRRERFVFLLEREQPAPYP